MVEPVISACRTQLIRNQMHVTRHQTRSTWQQNRAACRSLLNSSAEIQGAASGDGEDAWIVTVVQHTSLITPNRPASRRLETAQNDSTVHIAKEVRKNEEQSPRHSNGARNKHAGSSFTYTMFKWGL